MPDDPAAITAPDPDLRLKLAETEQLLAQARQALDAAAHTHAIERELWAHGALDTQAAAHLVSTALSGQAKPDVPAAVADLKRRKPFLFRLPAPAHSAMSGHAGAPVSDLSRAASDARDSGDRRDVLRYLRLKRGA
jgi:hypothetical protein